MLVTTSRSSAVSGKAAGALTLLHILSSRTLHQSMQINPTAGANYPDTPREALTFKHVRAVLYALAPCTVLWRCGHLPCSPAQQLLCRRAAPCPPRCTLFLPQSTGVTLQWQGRQPQLCHAGLAIRNLLYRSG